MRIWRSTVKLFRQNPAIELLAGLGVCVAVVTPFWILAGEDPAIESSSSSSSVKSHHVSSKETESLYSKLHKENSYLKQENEKLRKKVQLLNETNN